ncbi:amidohydrolase family protein [uncultured Pseudoteredinibacter sp.]|uniref:amidohydrolase family protein n=1 Tax=uncultured Pseudoteredinibacter sp. TaxID=1641701 RepID=UPI00262586D0|nr:amidohydrolase family protein [uncultured Pseudoteredinibacter sp.]
MIIDAHFHLWKLQRGDYGWITPELTSLYQDYQYSDWLEERGNDVRAGILVQCAPTLAETEFLLDIADKHTDILAVVGWVDLNTDKARQELKALSKHNKFVGVRPMLQDIANPRWILQEQVIDNLHYCAELNLSLDALITPAQLPYFCEAAVQLPELRIIIDHAAKPNLREQQLEEWRRYISILAGMPNIYCKLSGLLTEAKASATASDLQPCTDFLIDQFGVDHLVWGSDWPVLKLAASYKDWLIITATLCKSLSTKDYQKILFENALNFYGITLAAPPSNSTESNSTKSNSTEPHEGMTS